MIRQFHFVEHIQVKKIKTRNIKILMSSNDSNIPTPLIGAELESRVYPKGKEIGMISSKDDINPLFMGQLHGKHILKSSLHLAVIKASS